MVLRLSSEVLEDALLPEPLHKVPVLDDAVTDRILGGIAGDVCFVTNEEVWREGREGGRERERRREGGRKRKVKIEADRREGMQGFY